MVWLGIQVSGSDVGDSSPVEGQDRVDVDEERLYAGHLWVRVGWGVFG